MKGNGYPMVASHDPTMIEAASILAKEFDRAPDTWEHQMLYGIRSDEQRRLAAAGARVRVYIPYGTEWYGYFVRRLAEKPANLGFFLRALAGVRRSRSGDSLPPACLPPAVQIHRAGGSWSRGKETCTREPRLTAVAPASPDLRRGRRRVRHR